MQSRILEKFEKNCGFLIAKELKNRTEWRTLEKMLADNSVSKVKRGLYRLNDFSFDMQPMEVAKIVPTGVYCLFTAFRYYELTTYIPNAFHIAVARGKKVNLPDYPPVKVYYWIEEFHQLGVTAVDFNGARVKMYDLERSVCDVVKFRNKVGMDTTIEVLQNYVKRRDKNLNKLSRYAEQLGIDRLVNEMVMLLL
jgi:predicted transcriptional regulator of viral defense system